MDEQEAIASIIAQFPERFGLRAFPGDLFRISRSASYYSPGYGNGQTRFPATVYLYTQILNDDGVWRDFAKGTPSELRREMIKEHRENKMR